MWTRTVAVSAFGALAFAAPAAAQSVLSSGAYLEYDYDFEDETDEVIVGTYLDYETSIGIFAGLDVYTVDEVDDDFAVDVSFGYRGEAAGVSYEIAYYNYNLNETGSDGEELVGTFGYEVAGMSMTSYLGTDLAGVTYVGQDFGVSLPSDYAFSFGVEQASDSDELDWDIDLSKGLTDTVTLSGGVSGDTGDDNPEVYLAVSYDTSRVFDF